MAKMDGIKGEIFFSDRCETKRVMEVERDEVEFVDMMGQLLSVSVLDARDTGLLDCPVERVFAVTTVVKPLAHART
jgi:hypothetical protein